jgi:hypothetical protein
MTLSDHIRLAFGRPHVARGPAMADVTFDDGLEPPSAEDLEATHAAALQLWTEEQAANNVPPPVTRRQLKRWLHSRGLLEAVPQLIANIADTNARALAQIDWDEASVFEANNPLVLTFAAALGMTREQLHAAWIEAAQIF